MITSQRGIFQGFPEIGRFHRSYSKIKALTKHWLVKMRYPKPIKILEPVVANKIAAGEVVERPASVVKELVENAIDAASTDIRIEVRGGGLQLIRVVDNGWGMSAEEAELCFQRHATSKIESDDDLIRIETLGFRGEALPSIAAVARVTLVTRRPDDAAGMFVVAEGGRIVEKGKRGSPEGTTVSVQNLFWNIPARLKYMRAASTEFGHISHLVSQFALAYPEIRLTLVNEGRLSFQSVGDGDLFSALVKVYGVTTAEAMLPVGSDDESASSVRISGFIGRPSVSRSNRNYLSFFVNRRWIQSRTLTFAVEEAYHPLLTGDRHPVVVMEIEVLPGEVDVNVHPAKSEVRFLRDREVFALVQKAVRRALTENVSMSVLVSNASLSVPSVQHRLEVVDEKYSMPALPEREAQSARGEGLEVQPLPPADRQVPILRVIGQMANTFIIAEGPSGMYLVDQHRAHERVLFERLQRVRGGTREDSQLLLEPVTVEIAPQQAELLATRIEVLSQLGFAIEPFGERTYLVRAVPAVLGQANVADAITEILEQAVDERGNGDWRERLMATLACKGAIKAGQALTSIEMRELLLQLEATTIPPTCPHGSPTMVHLSQAQLEKQFGR